MLDFSGFPFVIITLFSIYDQNTFQLFLNSKINMQINSVLFSILFINCLRNSSYNENVLYEKDEQILKTPHRILKTRDEPMSSG